MVESVQVVLDPTDGPPELHDRRSEGSRPSLFDIKTQNAHIFEKVFEGLLAKKVG